MVSGSNDVHARPDRISQPLPSFAVGVIGDRILRAAPQGGHPHLPDPVEETVAAVKLARCWFGIGGAFEEPCRSCGDFFAGGEDVNLNKAGALGVEGLKDLGVPGGFPMVEHAGVFPGPGLQVGANPPVREGFGIGDLDDRTAG